MLRLPLPPRPVRVDARRRRRRRTAGFAVLGSGVVLADQLAKAWAWRHVAAVHRVTVDTGGGLLDSFVGGTANVVMADPLLGALADVLVAGVLVAVGVVVVRRWSDSRAVAAPLVATVVLAGCASNLLDRLGLHRWVAPGSARGVLNWIAIGGATTSPANVADLVIVGGLLVAGAAGVVRLVRRLPLPGHGRVAVLTATATLTVVSLLGAVGAADGSRERTVPGQIAGASSVPARAAAPRPVDLGAPAMPAEATTLPDVLQRVVTTGDRLTVTWTSESVTVTTHRVLGWRADGVSARYGYAFVAGPVRLELFLPPPGDREAAAGWCRWLAVPAAAPTPAAADAPVVWECNPGVPALSLVRAPVPYPV